MTAQVQPSVAEGLHVVLGSGPVGRAVAGELLRHEGTQVRLVSRSAAKTAHTRMSFVQADLLDRFETVVACAGAKTVTFAAAPAYSRWPIDFLPLQQAAMDGVAAAGAVFIAVENLYGYGVTGHLTEGMPLSATTRKGRVRATMTRELMEAHRGGHLRAVAGRASDLFGPEMAVSALGERAWPALLSGKKIDWVGDPDRLHSFTYLPDFARALVRLGADKTAWGRTWHVPSPPDKSPRDILMRAAKLCGLPTPKLRRVPKRMLSIMGVVSPLMREVAEMAYQFETDFIMDWSDWAAAFPERPTDWDTALKTTVSAWDKA